MECLLGVPKRMYYDRKKLYLYRIQLGVYSRDNKHDYHAARRCNRIWVGPVVCGTEFVAIYFRHSSCGRSNIMHLDSVKMFYGRERIDR